MHIQISTEYGKQYERYCSETNMEEGCSNLLAPTRNPLWLKTGKVQGKSTVLLFLFAFLKHVLSCH